MSDHASPEHGPEHGEPKHRSIVDLAELYQPIVPLPGRAGEGGADFVLDIPTAAAEWPAAGGVLTPRLEARASSEHLDPPSAQDDAPVPNAVAPSRPAWLRFLRSWAALLALGAASAGAAGALWVNHARRSAVQAPQRTAALAPPSIPAGPASTEAAPAPPSAATRPDAAAAAATLPTPAAPPAPAVSGPAPAGPVPTQAARRIVIYHRRTSPAAAARLSAQLRPYAAQVDQRAATAIPRLPTIRYFHPEDADAAEALATALGGPAAGWRVQGVSPRANPPPPGTFEVWLAKP